VDLEERVPLNRFDELELRLLGVAPDDPTRSALRNSIAKLAESGGADPELCSLNCRDFVGGSNSLRRRSPIAESNCSFQRRYPPEMRDRAVRTVRRAIAESTPWQAARRAARADVCMA